MTKVTVSPGGIMTVRRRRALRLITVGLALALVAAACSDDGDTATGDPTTTQGDTTTTAAVDATTTTAPPGSDETTTTGGDGRPTEPITDAEPFDSYRGVTADTITLGVLSTDLDELRELGLVDVNNGDQELIWNTLIDHYNENGGVAGRQLEIVYDEYNPVFNASADDACVRLTQDTEVFAVLGGVTGPAIDSVLCFVEQNAHMMIGGTHTPAHFPKRQAPWVAVVMSAERRHRGTLALYEQEGLLDGRVATYDDSSEHESVTEDIVLPALDELGVEVVQSFTSTIPQGDEVALQNQAETFAEVIADEDIDTLIIVQSQLAFGIAHMREAGFEGTILGIDTGTLVDTIGSLDERDPAIYEGTYAPMGASAEESWELPASQACYDILRERADIDVQFPPDVPDGEPNWAGGLTAPCEYLEIFKAAGDIVGGDLNPDTFLEAVELVGEIELTGVPFASLGPDKYDASDALRIGQFDPTVGESGRLVPVTDLQAVE